MAGSDTYDLRRLLTPAGLKAAATIGGVLAVIVGAFAYDAGWLSPERLTQARVVDQFEHTNGLHAGYRRNHSKGVCFTGSFESSGTGQRLSRSTAFAPGRIPVFGRFALAGGQPLVVDGPNAVHSMATHFALPDGQTWRMGMNGIPVFPVASAQDLVDQLAAATPDAKTGKPDPERLKAFLAAHPGAARAAAVIRSQPLASSFSNTTYNSLNAFVFVDASGKRTPVRWSMVPADAFQPAKPDPSQAQDPSYQFHELAERAARGPIVWQMVATVGQPGDATDDASVAWPADREKLALGTLTIDRIEDEAHGPCRDVTFDPLILPVGIEGSDDPILSARSAAYAESFTRRSGEPAPPPPVALPSSGAGGAR